MWDMNRCEYVRTLQLSEASRARVVPPTRQRARSAATSPPSSTATLQNSLSPSGTNALGGDGGDDALTGDASGTDDGGAVRWCVTTVAVCPLSGDIVTGATCSALATSSSSSSSSSASAAAAAAAAASLGGAASFVQLWSVNGALVAGARRWCAAAPSVARHVSRLNAVAVGHVDGTVSLMRASDLLLLRTLHGGHSACVVALAVRAWGPDTQLLSGCRGGRVCVWAAKRPSDAQ